MTKFTTIFTRKALLYFLLCYERMGKYPKFSYGYVSTVGFDYWGVGLNMLEDIVYPLGFNVFEALTVMETEGPEGLLALEPSENFKPIVHDRRLLLRVVQNLMHEKTGSDTCRATMSKRLGWETARVGSDFRSKAKTITLHLLELYCNAAEVSIADVFHRYYDLYGNDEKNINIAYTKQNEV